MPRSRRDGRFLIVTLWFGPHGTAGQGSRTNGSFPKGARRLSEKSPAGYPPAHHRDSTPRERGRLARMLSLGLPLSFPAMPQPAPPAGGNRLGPAEAEPWRRCRSIQVGEMAEAVPGLVRAGRPRSRVAFSHDVVTPTSQYCRSIRAPLVIEGTPSVFVCIRGLSLFPKRKRLAVSPLNDPPRRMERRRDQVKSD